MDWTEVIPKEWGTVSLEEAYRKVREAFDSCATEFRSPITNPPPYKVGDVVYISGKRWKLKRTYSGNPREFIAQEQYDNGAEGSYYGEPVLECWASPNARIDRWRRGYREYWRRLYVLLEALVRAAGTNKVIKARQERDMAIQELTDEDREWIKKYYPNAEKAGFHV
jgi:hypothetical protein